MYYIVHSEANMYKVILIFAAFVFQSSNGDSHNLGSCPIVDPLPGFDMNRFLGLWYAIQKTTTSTRCLKYNITTSEKSGHYEITEIKPHSPLWSSALYHEDRTTGELTVPDAAVPARMALDLPFDIGTTAFTIFMADYDNYAAVFTCKKYPLVHKWSAEILSRTPKLDMNYVDKIRIRLSSYNIDPFKLSIIEQEGCRKPGEKGSIIQIIDNVEEAIGDFVGDEAVAVPKRALNITD